MSNQIDHLTTALQEVRDNKDVFSKEAYSQIVLALLEKKRRAQTLKPLATTDEIRLVTVMFVDVKDSTEMARELGSGDWKTVIGESHQLLAKLITQWDGEVGQYLGDGLLCFFGAHHSKGDDAIRAVACALAVQKAMKEYGIDVYLRYANEFQVRIGISTGRVAVGMIGNRGKQEFLALGPATNLAARLQALADPGGILIDQQTNNRVRNHFVTKAYRPKQIKGFDSPIAYYEVEERKRKPPTYLTTSQIAGLELPFVGREAELTIINETWKSVTRDNSLHVITVSGDIGLGKSRLLQRSINQLTAQMPLTQLTMMAHYEYRNVSHNMLRDLLRTQCSLQENMPRDIVEQRIRDFVADTWNHPDAEMVAAVMGYITGYGFDDHPNIQPLKDDGRKREQIALSWLARWFRGLVTSSALLIVIDNLQWIDTASLELLAYLAKDMADMPCMLLLSGRRGFEMQHPQYQRLFEQHTMLTLETLSPDETSSLIQSVLDHVVRPPATLLPLIRERADGNPLFVQEILSMLFDNQVFHLVTPGRWKFDLVLYDSVISRLPDGLMGVMQARLDDLPFEARHVLQVASVQGPTFWLSALAEMADADPRSWLPVLEERGIVRHETRSSFDEDDEYQFRHTLYRDVSYEMLPRTKREAYHRQFAHWLLSRISAKQEFYPALAEQFELGGQTETALFTFLEAVQNRADRGMLKETQMLIDRGLSLASTVPRQAALPVTSQLWVIRGLTLNNMNRYAEASAASQSALRLFSELDDKELPFMRVEAYRSLGLALRSLGEFDKAEEALKQAQNWLAEDNLSQVSAFYRAFASLSFYRGNLREALEYMEHAWEAAANSGTSRQITGTMTELGLIALHRGDIATSLRYFELVLDVNRKIEDLHYQVLDLRNIGMVYHALFAIEDAMQMFDEAANLLQSLQQEDMLVLAYQGLTHIMMGDIDQGAAMIEQATKTGHPDIYNNCLLKLIELQGLVLIGKFVTCHEQATEFLEAIGDRNSIMKARALHWQGLAFHAIGDPRALPTLENATKLETANGGRDAWLMYQSLAIVETDAAKATAYINQCRDILQTITNSLHARPELQMQFTNNDTVRGILEGYNT